MADRPGQFGREDLERIASRLAMLVSEDGEAEAAGLATAHLARRLGLSGGDLKAMFLAGASSAQPAAASRIDRDALAELEAENARVRRVLRRTEEDARIAAGQNDQLRGELAFWRDAQERTQRRMWLMSLAALLLGAAGVAAGTWVLARVAEPAPQARQAAPFARLATVRTRSTVLYADADPGSAVLAILPSGTRLSVQRLRWNMMMQWVEVQVGAQTGFVRTTDVDLS